VLTVRFTDYPPRWGPNSARFLCQPCARRVCGADDLPTAHPAPFRRRRTDSPLKAGHGAPAVLFDVDGTLVDSNYLHVYAWQRAFEAEGMPIGAWRVHRSIGMDGERLVSTLTNDAPSEVKERLSDAHSRFYQESIPLLTPLPGARELLRRVSELGLQVVLASSAPEDELKALRKALDCDDIISETTSSKDVDTAKPEPGIVQVALDRAGVDAAHAVFVGDAVWDAKAAARAELLCIGLLSGGTSEAELLDAGASPVFADPQDLLDHLSSTRIAELAPDR
jgi:HAD superfamily hydrolase (TIGR01509 family)